METAEGCAETENDGDAKTGKRLVNRAWQMANGPKPRLVLLHYTAPPVVGSVEHVLDQQARLFLKRGYPVTIVAGRAGVGRVPEPCEVVVVPELDSENGTIRQIADALDSGIVLPEFRKVQLHIQDALRSICTRDALVIAHNVLQLHLNLPFTAALHHLMDEQALGQMIAWCHDVARNVNPTSGVPLRFGFPWDLLRTYRPDVKYVAVSRQRQRILSHVLECPQEQIRVIPNGVDPQGFGGLGDAVSRLVEEFELLQADLVLLMPVRITRAKNIKRALEIIACLRDMGMQVKLVVTGAPDPHALDGKAYFNELLALRHKLTLERQVIFVLQGPPGIPGPLKVGPEDAAELYRVSDLLLLTSNREGFGLPVLEAGLAGMPIFTTEVPALEEFEPDLVFSIARSELPTQVAKRIQEWAQGDRSHRLRRQVRHDYTWSAIFERHIEQLLQECTAACTVQA